MNYSVREELWYDQPITITAIIDADDGYVEGKLWDYAIVSDRDLYEDKGQLYSNAQHEKTAHDCPKNWFFG
jgi:hypothetical protein